MNRPGPVRLYFRYIGISIRSQMQYKASFVMMSVGNMILSGTEFVAIWALFDRFRSLHGWTLPEAALLYGLINIAFALSQSMARGFDMFAGMVKSGEFDRILLRPRGTILQLLGQDLELSRIGRLAQALVVLIWAIAVLKIAWTPGRVVLMIASAAGGIFFFSGLYVLQATMAFWTIESLEIWNTLTDGGKETAQYPLSIYRPWFRRFFTMVVPLACVNYFPTLAILGKAGSSGIPEFVCWLAPGAGLIFLLVSLRVWRIGVRHYCSTGS